MASKYEKQLNKKLEQSLEKGIISLGYFLKNFFISVFYGSKKLKQKKYLIMFLISFLIPILTKINKETFFKETNIYIKILYFLGLIAPILYLFFISKTGQKLDTKRFDEGFKLLNFIGVNEKYPKLIKQNEHENGIVEYYFKTLIPLEEWKKNLSRIETTLNLTVINLEQGDNKQIIYLKAIEGEAKIPELLKWDDKYIKNKNGVVVLGQTATGEIEFDFNKAPHMLSAGETGSGKSVIIRTVLWQLLNQGCECIMIDFKGGIEFGLDYEKIGEVVTEVDRAAEVFEELVKENARRMKLIRENGVKNIDEFNRIANVEKFKRIGVFVDELAQLMDSKGADKETVVMLKKIEGNLATLARLSRATGINLILGLQRPDANVLPGQIKNNIPVRVCGRFADKSASEIVLNNTRATTLKDIKGRFLFKVGADTLEFQSYFFEDEKHFNIDKLEENRERLINGDLIIEENYEVKKDNFIKKIFNKIKLFLHSKYKNENKNNEVMDEPKICNEAKDSDFDKDLIRDDEFIFDEDLIRDDEPEVNTNEVSKDKSNDTKVDSNLKDEDLLTEEEIKALRKEKLKNKIKF